LLYRVFLLRARVLFELANTVPERQLVELVLKITHLGLDALNLIENRLTGFFNRRYLDEALPALLQEARETPSRTAEDGKKLCICMLDLDHFRQINEQISHAVGDDVIQKAVEILKDVLLPDDIPVRYGGDEFVILMPRTSPVDAQKRAEAVRSGLYALDLLSGYDCSIKKVTTSIGIACFPDHAKDVVGLKEAADRALYRAKEEGRNKVFVFTEEG